METECRMENKKYLMFKAWMTEMVRKKERGYKGRVDLGVNDAVNCRRVECAVLAGCPVGTS